MRTFDVSDGNLTLRGIARGAAGDGLAGLAFANRDTTLVAVTDGGTVRLYGVSSGKPVSLGTMHPAATAGTGLDITSDSAGRTLALNGGETVLADVSGRRLAQLRAVPTAAIGGADSVALDPSGKLLAVGTDSETALFAVSAAKPRLLDAVPTDTAYAVAFDPHGATLAVGSQDGTSLFDIAQRRLTPLATVPAPEYVNSVAFAPNGTTLAAAGPAGLQLLGLVWPDYAYLRGEVCGLVWRNLGRSEWSTLAPPGLSNPAPCPSR